MAKDFGVGSDGKGTIFSIKCGVGKDITEYSAFPKEREVLLRHGMTFEVEACVKDVNGVNFITLRHVTGVPMLVM